MTVSKLIKKLQRYEKTLGPRAKVVIRLGELRLVGDEFSHWEASDCTDEYIPWTIPTRELADGTERMRSVVTIE